jgi:phosphoglycerate dehydrogenase-like enzyme
MAQYIIGMILLHANRVDRLYRDPRDWSIRRELQTQVLTGCTLGILGYGGTGRRTARIAAALGMRVIAIRRSTDSPAIERYLTPEIQDIDTVVDATEVWPIKSLSRLLKESDYVACALPLTSETRGLIGVSEISMMKKGAFLINVSRGRIVDEVALVEALTSGHLGGAALDVFDVEPLPESSSLWSAPNVTLTPHKAGSYDRLSEFMSGLFITNLKRYRAGLGLLNEASRDRGY